MILKKFVDYIFDKDFEEILGSQIISIIGGIIAGTVLAVYTEQFLLIPSMLILLPGFLEMRANISAPIASRLSSGLFLGVIAPRKQTMTKKNIIKGNIYASFLLTIIISLLLGFFAFAANYFLFEVYSPKLIFILLAAGLIANIIEVPITVFFTFYLFRKGHDPNNIMGPFLTSLADITSIVSLLIALVVIP